MSAWEEQSTPPTEMESPSDSVAQENTATLLTQVRRKLTVQLAHTRSLKVKLHASTAHLASCAMDSEPLTQSHAPEVDTVMVVELPRTVLQEPTTRICTPNHWSIAMIVLQEPTVRDPLLIQSLLSNSPMEMRSSQACVILDMSAQEAIPAQLQLELSSAHLMFLANAQEATTAQLVQVSHTLARQDPTNLQPDNLYV
jgi:hypothetical protein